jgi:manganese/zinc/iron transport system substrate-binding protein
MARTIGRRNGWWVRSALVGVVGAVCALAIGSCGERSQGAEAGTTTVVATVGMVADIVRGVAGDRAEVTALMGPGIDPHLYKPTRTDIQRILDADIVFYNGLLLEGRMTDSLVRAAAAGKPVIAVTEAMDENSVLEPAEFEGHADPHVWMDPRAWAGAVDVVRDRMTEEFPGDREVFATNAAAMRARILELDAYAERVLATVPEGQRVVVTAHDAFNYFGRRYGFEVVGIQGISTESEAGVRDIERLVDLLVSRQIPAVFVESTVSERNIDALRAGARARGHEVAIGGTLYSDAMGPDGTYEGTYIGMIDHNVTAIARALGGEAPERGMHGTLTP